MDAEICGRSLWSQLVTVLDHCISHRSGGAMGTTTHLPRPCCDTQVLLGRLQCLPGMIIAHSRKGPISVTQKHDPEPKGLPLAKVGPQYANWEMPIGGDCGLPALITLWGEVPRHCCSAPTGGVVDARLPACIHHPHPCVQVLWMGTRCLI